MQALLEAAAGFWGICLVTVGFRFDAWLGLSATVNFWARNFTPFTSPTQLLNQEHIFYVHQGVAERAAYLAYAIIPVEAKKAVPLIKLPYDCSPALYQSVLGKPTEILIITVPYLESLSTHHL